MKKIFILIIMTIFIVGCEAKYDLNYVNNTYEEQLLIISDENTKNDIKNYYNTNTLVDFNIDPGDMDNTELDKFYECYKKNLSNSKDNTGLELSYKYKDIDSYSNSNMINNLFRNISIDEYKISLTSVKNIFNEYKYLDKITISFSSDKFVLKGNYDEKIDNKYYWYIDSDNYESKNIKIELTDSKIESLLEENKTNSDKIINIAILILLIIILLSIVIVYGRVKKSNK